MPLLREAQIIDNDLWTQLNDEQEIMSDQDYTIINLQRFLHRANDGEPLPDGVSVAPADDVMALAPYVDQLQIVCIEIPVYTDGRGYSHARLLRRRLGYVNELRAVGDIRVDQILFLKRLGVDAFDCMVEPNIPLLQQLLTRFEHNYQPSYQLPLVS